MTCLNQYDGESFIGMSKFLQKLFLLSSLGINKSIKSHRIKINDGLQGGVLVVGHGVVGGDKLIIL